MKFVSISSLQKTTKPMLENNVVCVLKNNEPVFYTVSPERMAELLESERMQSETKSAWLNSKEYLDLAIKHMSDCDERNLIINAHNSMSELFFEGED